MEDAKSGEPGQAARSGLALTLLLLLATGIHAWVIARTTVTARDSIGYIRYALRFEREPWTTVLPTIEQHPLYPLAVLGMSQPVRLFYGGPTPAAMVLSSQLANALGGILLVIPMFFLGKELFGARAGFWAALLFQCLPICAQVTSDGLSDGLFLLLLATGLLFGVQALNRRSVARLFLCGLATGLAYLTRPEGALVAVATVFVLALSQALPACRWPWRRAAVGVVALGLGALVCAGPYMAVIGALTVKPSARRMVSDPHVLLRQDGSSGGTALQGRPDGSGESSHATARASVAPLRLTNVLLASWWVDEGVDGPPTLTWSLKAVANETIHAFQYVAWGPALVGLWWFRQRWRERPGLLLPLALCGLVALILGRLALALGYLSERHTLVLVLCGSLWAGAALVRGADSWPGLLARWRGRPLSARWATVLPTAVLLLWTVWCLPAALKPLHANRTGYRKAGEWLADRVQPGDLILDPFCWAHYYAGGVGQEQQPGPVAATHQPLCYVVLPDVTSTNAHNRFTMVLGPAQKLAAQGDVVFRWAPDAGQKRRYRAEPVKVLAVPKEAYLRQLKP